MAEQLSKKGNTMTLSKILASLNDGESVNFVRRGEFIDLFIVRRSPVPEEPAVSCRFPISVDAIQQAGFDMVEFYTQAGIDTVREQMFQSEADSLNAAMEREPPIAQAKPLPSLKNRSCYANDDIP
jgi:hypothetical protein